MPFPIALVMGLGQLAAGVTSKILANKQANTERFKANEEARRLKILEANRQEVIDKSQEIRDMKGEVFNPYANLAVAVKSADLQIEQTDAALANTLDRIQRGGMAEGGTATALAQAAAQSKAKVSATLEVQELQNSKARAQGEASAQAQKMQIEQMAIGEEVASWNRREGREMQRLNRTAALQRNAEMQEMAFRNQGNAALTAGIQGAIGGVASQITQSQKDGTNFWGGEKKMTIEQEMEMDKNKDLLLTPRAGGNIEVPTNMPDINLERQNVNVPAAIKDVQQISIPNTTRGLQGVGSEYLGIPMEGQVPFIQPQVNFFPQALQNFTPSNNPFFNPIDQMQGYDLGQTIIDPLTGLTITQ